MKITENKKIIKQNGFYFCEIDEIVKKLKNEEFPSKELKEKYPEDFIEYEKHSTMLLPPENSGLLGMYSGCMILID